MSLKLGESAGTAREKAAKSANAVASTSVGRSDERRAGWLGSGHAGCRLKANFEPKLPSSGASPISSTAVQAVQPGEFGQHGVGGGHAVPA